MVMPRLMSCASVCLATTPLNQPAELTAWSVAFLPPARERLPITVTESRCGASGVRIGVISSSPAALGIQLVVGELPIGAPLGTYTAPKRSGAPARCWPRANAGVMASRNGSASAVPSPRRTVRRDNAVFVTNIEAPLGCLGNLLSHPERHALHDACEQRREPVVPAAGVADDFPDNRHIVRLQPAPERVNHQLLGQRENECILVPEERLAQLDNAVYRGAVRGQPCRVDR